jgi:hypothetical protein
MRYSQHQVLPKDAMGYQDLTILYDESSGQFSCKRSRFSGCHFYAGSAEFEFAVVNPSAA